MPSGARIGVAETVGFWHAKPTATAHANRADARITSREPNFPRTRPLFNKLIQPSLGRGYSRSSSNWHRQVNVVSSIRFAQHSINPVDTVVLRPIIFRLT